MKKHHLGTQGHFICDCDWHRHTHIGNICISTVGDYRSKAMKPLGKKAPIEEIGYERLYETLVQKFRWTEKCNECGKKHHRQGKPIRMVGYNTKKDAIAGHRDLVAEYDARVEKRRKVNGIN